MRDAPRAPARDIFVEGSARGIPTQVLPLALLALERGSVLWADAFLVRRELGSHHGDLPGLGLSPRALREAHLMQYELHLRDVVEERRRRGLPDDFAATEHFLALPPAGRLPRGAVDATAFTQTFFPPEVDVDLALVPEDEVPALLRDSLLLPPIDLTLGPEGLASTPVLALVPVGRDTSAHHGLPHPARPLGPARPHRPAEADRPAQGDQARAARSAGQAASRRSGRRGLAHGARRRRAPLVRAPPQPEPAPGEEVLQRHPGARARAAQLRFPGPPRARPGRAVRPVDSKVEPPKIEPPKAEPPKVEPRKVARKAPETEPEISPRASPKMSPKKPKGRLP